MNNFTLQDLEAFHERTRKRIYEIGQSAMSTESKKAHIDIVLDTYMDWCKVRNVEPDPYTLERAMIVRGE
jgi:hypothetical protein